MKYHSQEIEHISKNTFESAKYAVRGKFKKIKNPKYSIGDKCWTKQWVRDEDGKYIQRKSFGVICSSVFVEAGSLRYDVLVEGTCQAMTEESIYKR